MDQFDDDFDDDEDFIALTAKAPAKNSNFTQRTNVVLNSKKVESNSFPAQSSDLLVAKGEIAVLRSKLDELQKTKLKERDLLIDQQNKEKQTTDSQINALKDAVQRLEDERKFLSAEVRNLSSRNKRRKRASLDAEKEVEVPDIPVPRPTDIQTDSQHETTTITTAKPIQLQAINENNEFIDYLMTHVILGCPKTSLEYLFKVKSSISSSSEYFKPKAEEPIATEVIRFLHFLKDGYRLDELVSHFIENLLMFIMDLIESNPDDDYFCCPTLPIPLLLSLIHGAILFRPSALTRSSLQKTTPLVYKLINSYTHLMKPEEEEFSTRPEFKLKSIQYEFLDHLILIFAFDVFEVLVQSHLNHDSQLLKSNIIQLHNHVELIPFIRSNLSTNTSNVNIMFNVVNILSFFADIKDEDIRVDNLFQDQLILNLVRIIDEDFSYRPKFLITGLNRILGNSFENQLINDLYGQSEVSSIPQVIYPQKIKDSDVFTIQNSHEIHLLNLRLLILALFEKLIITKSNGIGLFNKDHEILRSLIFSIAKQQEHNFHTPESNTVHLRYKLITSTVRVIYLIWEITSSTTNILSILSKDSQHELMVTLARIAFSRSTAEGEAGSELKTVVSSKFAESSYLENSSSARAFTKSEEASSNLLEFADDDEVAVLARDLLEKCTTMDEADDLYASMHQ